jgi:hypothetical protein
MKSNQPQVRMIRADSRDVPVTPNKVALFRVRRSLLAHNMYSEANKHRTTFCARDPMTQQHAWRDPLSGYKCWIS